jgi:phosphotransacetylase
MAGIVMGATAPVVLTSRSDPSLARVYSLALAGLLC